ncbi:MAG TPA: hypothetical protein VEC99_10575 [Clostridia bacterium]|nr:hypothetical protein [Clostridia bacterium]
MEPKLYAAPMSPRNISFGESGFDGNVDLPMIFQEPLWLSTPPGWTH